MRHAWRDSDIKDKEVWKPVESQLATIAYSLPAEYDLASLDDATA